MEKCKTCGREMNHATNLGGDCLFCMAEAGDPDAIKRCITRARNFDEMENGKRPDLLKSLVDTAVKAERQRCSSIAQMESSYWGAIEGPQNETDKQAIACIMIGAMGCGANILMAILIGTSEDDYEKSINARDHGEAEWGNPLGGKPE